MVSFLKAKYKHHQTKQLFFSGTYENISFFNILRPMYSSPGLARMYLGTKRCQVSFKTKDRLTQEYLYLCWCPYLPC